MGLGSTSRASTSSWLLSMEEAISPSAHLCIHFCTAEHVSAVEPEPQQVMVGLETLHVLALELCAQMVEGTDRIGEV